MTQSEQIDTCVVGAGVVGLAIARQLSAKGRDVLVLEAGPRFGGGISSRSSEVVHAGLYYPPNSLKAKLCVRGKALLYDYCKSHQVSYHRIGKLVIACNPAEISTLESLAERANANGVSDLELVSKSRVAELEPSVRAEAALLSPSTGIVSAHELMLALLADIESAGGSLALQSQVESVAVSSEGFSVTCEVEGQSYHFSCRRLVNAAGLGAQQLARSIDSLDPSFVPPLYYCRGSYFVYQASSPFKRLIYPLPDASGAGLGVHATIDMGGQLKFGPDVEYIEAEDYQVSALSLTSSIEAIRRYFPSLDPKRLTPGYAGIRPKLQGPGDAPQDFVIQGPEAHGLQGLVNLFGIESPGLTSSMAIAETVDALLGDAW